MTTTVGPSSTILNRRRCAGRRPGQSLLLSETGCIPTQGMDNPTQLVDAESLARDVEEAAECFSWSPSLLGQWLKASSLPPAITEPLELLASGLSISEVEHRITEPRWQSSQPLLAAAIVQIVADGPTPNEVRCRVGDALAQHAGSEETAGQPDRASSRRAA
jgi:hypothetical protein